MIKCQVKGCNVKHTYQVKDCYDSEAFLCEMHRLEYFTEVDNVEVPIVYIWIDGEKYTLPFLPEIDRLKSYNDSILDLDTCLELSKKLKSKDCYKIISEYLEKSAISGKEVKINFRSKMDALK